jgi:hypothetical protein
LSLSTLLGLMRGLFLDFSLETGDFFPLSSKFLVLGVDLLLLGVLPILYFLKLISD